MVTKPRIFLVDDDSQVRALALDLLKQEFPDYQFEEVVDGSGLARALEQDRVGLVITDYQLSWTNGLEVFRQVKARWPGCPVIMFTGTGSEKIAVEAMKAGLDDYVPKSSNHIDRLVASVRTVLEQAEVCRKAREADARYRSLINDVVETSAVAVLILDAGFRVVWANAAFEQYFGLKRDLVIGRDTRELIRSLIQPIFDHPADFTDRVLRTYEDNTYIESFECHVRAGEGREERWIEHRSLPINTGLYAGGRIEHYYDITRRKRSEEERDRFFMLSLDFLCIVGFDLHFKSVNPAFVKALGYSEEELLSVPCTEFVHPDDHQATLAENERQRAGIPSVGFQNRYRCKDGSYRWLSWNSIPSPEMGSGYAIARDVTDAKRTQEALRSVNETLNALVQASPLAIIIVDQGRTVTLWSPAAERLFGWRSDEALGRPLPTVPQNQWREHQKLFEQILAGETCIGRDVVRQRKDGSLIHVSLSTAPLRDTGGRVTGIMGLMADITERKQMEAQARRLERLAAMGQLLGGIAHELKNPLFILTGHLQLAREKLAQRDYEGFDQDLQRIETAGTRMSRTIERFIELARPTTPRVESCSVRAALEQVLDFLANELMRNSIQVRTDFAADIPEIECDPRQLHDLFLNLSLNAIQAMAAAHGRGTLTVSAQLSAVSGQPSASGEGQKGNWIEVRIQDDGPGIPPELRGKIFEPFFSAKPPEQGTGLGLWTVRTIV
ncbi:MAG: PAS domain S-box protein, partial [Nitrospirae bacterium]